MCMCSSSEPLVPALCVLPLFDVNQIYSLFLEVSVPHAIASNPTKNESPIVLQLEFRPIIGEMIKAPEAFPL